VEVHVVSETIEFSNAGSTTILIDMDGVLFWWEKHFINEMRRLHPHIKMIDFGKRTLADQPLIDAIFELEETQEVLRSPGFYASLDPIEGATDALDEMSAEGFDLSVCTSPSLRNRTCASDKFFSLERFYGRKYADTAMILKDKTRARGDLLVDDKLNVRGKLKPEWDHIVFDQSYNRTGDDSRLRMHGWKDWRRAVDSGLKVRELRKESA
jgi:5'-nucleotidase